MSNENLCPYLKSVAELEQDIYTLEETKAALHAQKRKTTPKQSFPKPDLDTLRLPRDTIIQTEKPREVYVIWMVVAFFALISLLLSCLSQGGAAMVVFGIPLAIFIATRKTNSITDEQHSAKEAELKYRLYTDLLAQYEQKVAQEDARYEQEEIEVVHFNRCLQEQINQIDKTLVEAKRALQSLYALDIIHPKYRAIIPVTMFCEYVETGRCDDLAGANGAYNKYEEELRMELIIGSIRDVKHALGQISIQLGQLSMQIEKIQQNQYLLFKAMQESNRHIEEIAHAAASMAKDEGSVAKNTAWIAYNAEVTARCARAVANHADREYWQKYGRYPPNSSEGRFC